MGDITSYYIGYVGLKGDFYSIQTYITLDKSGCHGTLISYLYRSFLS